MAHHVLRRLLRRKKFRLASPVEGVSLDPNLLLLYVLKEAGLPYFESINGIDVASWPDSLKILADADPPFFKKIDGLGIGPWPDSLNLMGDAGFIIFEKLNGISTDPWPETIKLLKDSDPFFFSRIHGIDINSWPDSFRMMLEPGYLRGPSINGVDLKRFVSDVLIMSDASPLRQGSIQGLAVKRVLDTLVLLSDADPMFSDFFRGSELGDPSLLRLETAPFFNGVRWPYQDGIEIKRFINDMIMFREADPFRGGVFRGPELGDPSLNRLTTAPFFSGFVWPYQDGLEVLQFFGGDFFMMGEVDPIRGGVFRGPELGDPSLNKLTTAPFLGGFIWPYQDGIEIKDIIGDLIILKEPDPFRGGVIRGGEIGDPSPLRLEVDVDLKWVILPDYDRISSDIVPVRTITPEEIGQIYDVPKVKERMFATSNSFAGFGTAPEIHPFTRIAKDDIDISVNGSDKLLSVMYGYDFTYQTIARPDGISTDGPVSRINVLSELRNFTRLENLNEIDTTGSPTRLSLFSELRNETLVENLNEMDVDPFPNKINVASDLGPLVPAVTGLGSYGLEVGLSYSVS
jgi:hypothetical protein